MYVSEFKIENFRSHIDVGALLQPTLTPVRTTSESRMSSTYCGSLPCRSVADARAPSSRMIIPTTRHAGLSKLITSAPQH
jgi:hypothetical protein